MSEEKNILTVVEELKGLQLNDFTPKMYDTDFWLPYIPLKNKKFDAIEPKKKYSFEVQDIIELDPTGLLKKELDARGTFTVKELESKGGQSVWEIELSVESFKAEVGVRIRARDLPNGLKIGIFIYKLEYDWGLLQGIGTDAVLFGARVKLRDLLQEIQKKMKKS